MLPFLVAGTLMEGCTQPPKKESIKYVRNRLRAFLADSDDQKA